MVAGLSYCVYLFFTQSGDQENQDVTFSNPFDLGPAIKFGLIFALILLLSKAAQVYFGNIGIYLSSFVAGLADADAIALSLTELTRGSGGIDMIVAARAIVVAVVANTLAKGGIVLAGGTSALRRAILPGFLLMMAVGIIVVFFV